MLTTALGEWTAIRRALRSGRGLRGVGVDVGEVEESGGCSIIQPDGSFVVDIKTGRLIVEQARKILAAELLKLGVRA